MIALSFVRTVQDVAELRAFLQEIGRPDIRIMSKIETRQVTNYTLILGKYSKPF